jgi:isopentenyl diphosphate isomerase/L-lactate dehydrogenase-like FMN-dependent dehydrogenase
MRPGRVINVDDARAAARRVLPPSIFDYVDGGAEDEVTLRRNREAFAEVMLVPKGATRVGNPVLGTSVCGVPVSMPVLLAPCGQMQLVHPEGDLAGARAAKAEGTLSVLSSASGHTLEAVAAESAAFFQLYTYGGRTGTENLIDRVRAANFKGLVVTVDTPTEGNRERDRRHGYSKGIKINFRNAVRFGPGLTLRPRWLYRFLRNGLKFELANVIGEQDAPVSAGEMPGLLQKTPPTWEDIEWIRQVWTGPLLVKGLLRPEDAKRAVDCGADGIVVSNHGGRQLDGAPSTIDVLPRIVDAVPWETEVLLDSGVRRGTDVVKALALGAKAVLVGRPYAYGLAIGGEAGVTHVLEILRSEIHRTLVQLGCPSVGDLDRTYVAEAPRGPTSLDIV